MLKNFISWIKIKFNIHTHEKRPYFNEREVWWSSFGQNIGDEENGKGDNFMRPVVVIRKFNRNICLVVPTSSILKDNKFYYEIEYKNQKYSALLSHLRTIDVKRLRRRITRLDSKEFERLVSALKELVFRQKIDP
ncbi:MAG: type II toxin-antitoxin system PemK/MazF family toxin [bacterium]